MSDLDPFSSACREDPYPVYRALRNDAPVHFVPSMDTWCVSRYDDVQHVLKNPELFSSRAMFTVLINNGSNGLDLSWGSLRLAARLLFNLRMSPWAFVRSRILIASDGDRHSSMRGILNRGFTPRQINNWESRIRTVVENQLEPLRGGDPFDVVGDLAIPLPVTIIAELLGVERDRHADFKRWSDAVIYNATGPGRADPFNTAFLNVMQELFEYFEALIEQRRAEPSDDLIGQIVASQGSDPDPLTPFEIIQFIVLLLVAGNETTTNLIGNGVDALLRHPDQLSRVLADPALVPSMIEETLRFDAPVQVVFRNTLAATEINGTKLPKGAFVAALIGSANRDERQFDDADRFDIARHSSGHLGFGFGKHFCLGASLARLQARAAFEALIPELAQVTRPQGKLHHIDSFLVRGVESLPIRQLA
jgi:cytochrome P450